MMTFTTGRAAKSSINILFDFISGVARDIIL